MTTTLTHEVCVVRRSAGESVPRPTEWCPVCAGPSGMLAPEEAAAVSGLGTRTIYREIEAGRVHFAESPDGRLLVCLASLPCAVG